jgi:putative sigma-54 modulation protein
MKLIISGRNLPLTDGLKAKITEKLEKIRVHYDFLKEVNVFLSVEKNPRITDNQIVEATLHVNGATLRLETASEDLYASVDMIIDKIDRALRRYKTKLLGRNKSGRSSGGESMRHVGSLEASLNAMTPAELADDDDNDDDDDLLPEAELAFADYADDWQEGDEALTDVEASKASQDTVELTLAVGTPATPSATAS